MGCYHPLIRVEDLTRWETAKDGHKYHPARVFNPEGEGSNLENFDFIKDGQRWGNYTLIGCGHCVGCRLEYSRIWANRGYLESKEYENNWFITLTYDDKYLPVNDEIEDENGFTYTNDGTWTGTLKPEDVDKFLHDLRQEMARHHNQSEGIRYMKCGEYGSDENTSRPHYHLIIFNLNLPADDLYDPEIVTAEGDQGRHVYYKSHIIEKCWKYGISNITEASWNTIAYVSRYITKKQNGEMAVENYEQRGRIKEFFNVSNRPGIGYNYYQKHKDEIYRNDEIVVLNQQGIVSCKPPRYFDDLYKKEHPDKFEKLKAKRKVRGTRNAQVKDLLTSLNRQQQLNIDESQKLDQSYKLIRAMEKKAGL